MRVIVIANESIKVRIGEGARIEHRCHASKSLAAAHIGQQCGSFCRARERTIYYLQWYAC